MSLTYIEFFHRINKENLPDLDRFLNAPRNVQYSNFI